jgi:hypothetical protein
MDPLSYKALHVLGLFLVFTGLGGLMVQALTGTGDNRTVRRLVGIAHGVGLLIVLVSGFGGLARLHVGFPLWAILKIAVWIVIGGVIVVIRRQPKLVGVLWWLLPLLGAFAGYLAIFKPF